MSAHLRNLRQIDPVLTNLSVGYRQSAFIGEQIFPVVFSEKEGFKVPVFGKASFVEYETERAVGAESNIITLDSANSLPVVLEEHDLAAGVDYRAQNESMFDEKAKATRRVSVSIKALEMKDEQEAIEQFGSSDSGASLGDILGAALKNAAKD